MSNKYLIDYRPASKQDMLLDLAICEEGEKYCDGGINMGYCIP